MKHLLFLFSIITIASCSSAEKSFYGSDFEVVNALGVDEIIETIESNQKSDEVIVQGTISASCQQSGCWMHLKSSNDDVLMVSFKDYGFFIPKKNMIGKEVAVKGFGEKTITSIEDLKHYAQDEGLSQQEIDAIDEVEVSYSFVADGVKMIER